MIVLHMKNRNKYPNKQLAGLSIYRKNKFISKLQMYLLSGILEGENK
jgi:hypothetical protein